MVTRTRRRRTDRPARPAAVHARHPSDRLPKPPVDDAHVRGVRLRRGHQPALPPAAGRGADRALDRLRHADALRLRHRRPRGGRRVRHLRGRRQQPGRHGGPPLGSAARQGVDLDDDQFACRSDLGDVHRRGGEGRRAAGSAGRHAPERHPQGIRRPEGVPVPARTVDAPRHRHHRVRHPRAAALEHDLDQRLPHPRGGFDGRPGAGLHHRRRDGLRRGRAAPRSPDRRLRPAPVVLLQLAFRLLRGDRQVPGEPADLARPHDQAVRRGERTVRLDAVPYPDGRRVADAPAAAEQSHPSGAPGVGRGPRRDAVTPYRRVRRGTRRADRRGGPPGPAPAARHRRGERAWTRPWILSAARGSSRR